MTSTQKTKKQARGLLLIAAFKILKGLVLMAVGFGALHFLHRDLAAEIARWVDLFASTRIVTTCIGYSEKSPTWTRKKSRELSVGTFFYSALFLCEGVGLALRRRWAEYLTIISTASLMPIEILEIHKSPSAAKVVLLLINLAVVVYLVRELRSLHGRPTGERIATRRTFH